LSDNQKIELLKKVFGLSKEIGKVTFPLIVKLSTGYEVIPFDTKNSAADNELMEIMSKILKKFLRTSTSTHSRYEGGRVNEVGRRIEQVIVHEMDKHPLKVKQLPKSGYPDIEIVYNGITTYLEMKTSSVKKKSGFRYFYYTSGTKINTNARHLLLNVTVSQEEPKYWKVENWALSDLSKLDVKLKNEFNASKSDLLNEKARIISTNV
jgi:hypothetical protein